jgi:hypothetical protein
MSRQQKEQVAAEWISAIEEAGAMASDRETDPNIFIGYLHELKFYLEARRQHWFQLPKTAPAPPPIQRDFSLPSYHAPENENSFAVFEDGDQDDAAYEGNAGRKGENIANAGQRKGEPRMVMSRLMVRVLTTLSEFHRVQADRFAREHDWARGTEAYSHCFDCIGQALLIADEQFAKLIEEEQSVMGTCQQNRSGAIAEEQAELAEDAQVVHVANSHFAIAQERYQLSVGRRMQAIQRKLRPQWKSRDEVKQTWGEERWASNPRPKLDYARMRERDEQELRVLREAEGIMASLNSEAVRVRSEAIMGGVPLSSLSGRYASVEGSMFDFGRHNGNRPSDTSQRVDMTLYPDPTEFNWTFTGSNEVSRVEFFERWERPQDGAGLLKLDFFYTTGTLKTSLDHPQ